MRAMLERLDLNAVRTFVEVARSGGFAAAGRRLGLPRSTVSMRVSNLEQVLEVRLFRRSTRAVTLTDEGRALLAEAGPALDRIMEAALGTSGETRLRGTIRMTAPADFMSEAISAAIVQFRKQHPEVRIELHLASATLDMVEHGIDLALRTGDRNAPDTVLRPLPPFRYGFYASPVYLASCPTPQSLESSFDFLAPHSAIRTYLERHALAGKSLPRGVLEANSFTLLRRLAVDGAGIAALPSVVAQAEVVAGRLVEVLTGQIQAPVKMSLAFPSRADISLRVRLFADALETQLTQSAP
jgi:DNA-binding transcriptional LysR family regulator